MTQTCLDTVRVTTAAPSRAARAARTSGPGRLAGEAQAEVVEHRVGRAGRGAGRVEVGGGDRADLVGRSARPPPRPPGRSRTRWSGPALVTWKVPGARAAASRRRAGARSAVKVGQPCWSSTKASSRSGSAASRPSTVLHHVADRRRRTPTTCARRWRRAAGAHLVLAGELRAAVDRQRAGGVPLDVRRGLGRRRTRSRWRGATRWAPTRPAASATLPGADGVDARRPARDRPRRRRPPSRRRSARRRRAPSRGRAACTASRSATSSWARSAATTSSPAASQHARPARAPSCPPAPVTRTFIGRRS